MFPRLAHARRGCGHRPARRGAASGADEPARQWHALPVEGGDDAIARAAGLEPGLPAWRVLYEACRRRHGLWGEDAGSAAEPPPASRRGTPSCRCRSPRISGAGCCGAAHELPDGQLALAILADRRSALLYRGLAGLDEETLAALAAEPDALRRIQRRHARRLRRVRLALRGARRARGACRAAPRPRPIWQAVVGESPGAPAALPDQARSSAARGGSPSSTTRWRGSSRRASASRSGSPSAPGKDAAAPLRRSVAVFEAEAAWWRYRAGRLRAPRRGRGARDAGGAARGGRRASRRPASQRLLDGASSTEGRRRPRQVRASPRGRRRLARGAGSAAATRALRRLRLEQLAFAQRVFGAAAEAAPAEAIQALAGLVDARALVLSLERFGSTRPGASSPPRWPARGARWRSRSREDLARAHAGFQGALGVIDRARFSGALDTAAAERLVRSLRAGAAARTSCRGSAASAAGSRQTLLPALARAVGGGRGGPRPRCCCGRWRASALERPASAASSTGRGSGTGRSPSAPSCARLEGVRRRQARPEPARGAARVPRPDREGAPRVRRGGGRGAHLARLRRAPRRARRRRRCEERTRRGATPSCRIPGRCRARCSGPGVPWHVKGSLLGLETALARLSLHRLDADALPDRAPRSTPRSGGASSISAGARQPRSSCATRTSDALAAAVAAGRRRAQALGREPPTSRPSRATRASIRGARAGSSGCSSTTPGRSPLLLARRARLPRARPRAGAGTAGARPIRRCAGLRLRLPAAAAARRELGPRARARARRRLRRISACAWRSTCRSAACPRASRPRSSRACCGICSSRRGRSRPDDRLALDAWARDQPAERLDDAVAALVGRGPLQPAPAPGRTR